MSRSQVQAWFAPTLLGIAAFAIVAATVALAGPPPAAAQGRGRRTAEPVVMATGTAHGSYSTATMMVTARWGREYMLVVEGTRGATFQGAFNHTTMTRSFDMSQSDSEIRGRVPYYGMIAPPSVPGRITQWTILVQISNPTDTARNFDARVVDVTGVPPDRRPGAAPSDGGVPADAGRDAGRR